LGAYVEEGEYADFRIERSNITASTETVYISTVQNRGFSNEDDYEGLLNIPYTFSGPSDTTKFLVVRTFKNVQSEGRETFSLIVQDDPNASTNDNLANIDWGIDDPVITWVIDDATPGGSNVDFKITSGGINWPFPESFAPLWDATGNGRSFLTRVSIEGGPGGGSFSADDIVEAGIFLSSDQTFSSNDYEIASVSVPVTDGDSLARLSVFGFTALYEGNDPAWSPDPNQNLITAIDISDFPYGDFYTIFVVDPNDNIEEIDETNNIIVNSSTLTVSDVTTAIAGSTPPPTNMELIVFNNSYPLREGDTFRWWFEEIPNDTVIRSVEVQYDSADPSDFSELRTTQNGNRVSWEFDILEDGMTEGIEYANFRIFWQSTDGSDPAAFQYLTDVRLSIEDSDDSIGPIPINNAPEAIGSEVLLAAGTSIPLADLFDWSDPDGLNDVVSFAVRDRTDGSGYLTLNGVRQTDSVLFDEQPISEIGNWAFVAGAAGNADEIGFNAIDAEGVFNTPSAIATVTATTPTPTNQAPEVSGDIGQDFDDLSPVALRDIFSLSDPNGIDDIVSVEFSDDTPGSDGGLFLSAPPFGAPFTVPRPVSGSYRLDITPAELEFWSYQPGTFGDNSIQIEAADSEGNVSNPLVINLTFTDPDPTPIQLSFEDTSLEVGEGEKFFFRLNFSEALPATLTGNFVVSFDTAETTDITQSTGQFIVSAGQDFGLVTIGTFQDTDFDNEQITVSLAGLSGISGIQVVNGPAIGTIIDDDTPPLEAPMIIDPGLITVQTGATGVIHDLVATDDEDTEGEGGGLVFTRNPSPDQLKLGVDLYTGEITFNRASDGSLPEDADSDGIYELTVGVTDSDSLSDTVDLRVQVLPENKNADAAILEYLAKEVVYGRDLVSAIFDPANAELLSRLGGLNSSDIEYTFADQSGTFLALAISKPGYNPILAFRGTQPNAADWAENFRPTGVGLEELNRGLDATGVAGPAAAGESAPTLREWLFRQEDLSITGHSQGGAQAQLAAWVKAKEAVDSGNAIDIAQVMTFNSAGMTLTQPVMDSLPTLFAGIPVQHSINAGDLVSLTGNSFLPGTIEYHDNSAGLNPASAHTEYWVNDELRSLSTIRATPILRLEGGPDWAAFTDKNYSPVAGNFGQDSEYQDFLDLISSLGGTLGGVINVAFAVSGTEIVTIESSSQSAPIATLNVGDFNFREFIVDNLIPALSSRGRLAEELAGENGALIRELISIATVLVDEVENGAEITVKGEVFGDSVEYQIDFGTMDEELHSMAPGQPVVLSGSPDELFGDRATDFREEDRLVISETQVTPEMFDWYLSSAVLTFDLDLDGEVDGEITLEGDYFEGAEFSLEIIGNDTHITVDLNQAPVATDDSYTIQDGDVLTVAAGSGLLANDTDADGDPLQVQSITAPSDGTLNIATDGSFTYTPDAGFVGQEVLTYTITDGAETTTADVNIDVMKEAGPNIIVGTPGNDALVGTEGNDLFKPIAGELNTLTGMGGADVFEFRDFIGNGTRDVANILDFDVAMDKLGLDLDDVAASRGFAGNTYLNLAGGENDMIVLQGVETIDEFNFV
jgi:hypothetical protein